MNESESLSFEELKQRSCSIRELYHKLEERHHQAVWNIEEDALAFLTDASLIGRLVMDHQKRWPYAGNDSRKLLEHKLGECVWWLSVMATRMDIDLERCTRNFLKSTEEGLSDAP